MLLHKIINKIRYKYLNFKIKRAHSEHRRLNAKKYEHFDSIIELYRNSGGLKHDFQSYKLFSLSELLEKESPKDILELGTGSTTAVFVEYVRRRNNTHLTCIDESQHWLEKNKRLSGVAKLEPRIEFLYAPKVVSDYLTPKEISYDMKCDKSYDFVFIDGPSLRINGYKDKNIVNSNIFDIVKYKKPKLIVVDIRLPTVRAIIDRLGAYYDIYVSDVLNKDIDYGYRYFTIFKLKSEFQQ